MQPSAMPLFSFRIENGGRSSASDDPYELEADHFAAALLMPDSLFRAAISTAGTGLAAVEALSNLCVTSLTATAIRYARRTDDAG